MEELKFTSVRNIVLAIILVQVVLHTAWGKSNVSDEHTIRKILLDDYDKTVLPFKGVAVNVEFALKLNQLVKVDTKEQLIQVDTWVIMKWNNTFFSWNKNDYNGRDRVHFLPSEVWFPDIALYNNGDSDTPRAGGRSKFLSNVVVNSDGENTWSGPASFTASCELTLSSWPFDTQTCEFRFGSFSYNHRLLEISSFKTKSILGDNFVGNGDWSITSINIDVGETDHGNCCPYEFSQITYTLKMARLFKYQMFYLVAPCLILSILTLTSFWIPSESGERIGFVTTLLLGMMVFLLVVPDSLPESSKSIPILGTLLMCTLVVLTCVLICTIVVLRCFHSTGTPPKYIRWLSKSMPKETTVDPIDFDKEKRSSVTLRAVQPFQVSEPANTITNESKFAPSWQEIADRLDSVFFWFFLVVYVVVYAVLLTFR